MGFIKTFLEDLELELHRGQLLVVTRELFQKLQLEQRTVAGVAANRLKAQLRATIPGRWPARGRFSRFFGSVTTSSGSV